MPANCRLPKPLLIGPKAPEDEIAAETTSSARVAPTKELSPILKVRSALKDNWPVPSPEMKACGFPVATPVPL